MILIRGLFLWIAMICAAFAQTDPNDAARRKVVVPFIRALTNCVAQTASKDAEAVGAYEGGTLAVYLRQQLRQCSDQVTSLLNEYDQVYGEGEGARFIKGPYSGDLERAVLARIKGTLDSKVSELRQDREAQAQRDQQERANAEERARIEAADHERRAAQARAEEESQLAEAKQRAEQQKAAAIEAEANVKAVAAKAEAEKQARLDDGRRAISLLREKYDACAVKQLRDLVKSGEAASVLASAVLTICDSEINTVADAASSQWATEQGRRPSSVESDAISASLREILRDRTTAYAVQAKAGVGQFSAH